MSAGKKKLYNISAVAADVAVTVTVTVSVAVSVPAVVAAQNVPLL